MGGGEKWEEEGEERCDVHGSGLCRIDWGVFFVYREVVNWGSLLNDVVMQ